ncbi:MAG: flagellin [Cognatishimia sp.]|uniref:flagellin N-terminal helical domain-containing protein n=1 Tax=Cognatishimia sp. WU-CL00825 TaxID=3127658 RepID=UPI003102946A
MSSILTNNSAMIALQTLKHINSSLAGVQSEISTGKRVATASDSSAMWAISKIMESDVQGFKSISESLSLGKSTVAVARNAAETVTDLLIDMKEIIATAQGDNVDRAKLDADVDALTSQIQSVVGAAQFNGLNLVDGSTGSTAVLASLDRDSSGNVTASSITVTAQNLASSGYTANDIFGSSGGTPSGDGDTVVLSLDNGGGTDNIVIDDTAGAAFTAGDRVNITIGSQVASYTLTANDVAAGNNTSDLAAAGLKNAIDALNIADLVVDFVGTGQLDFTNDATTDVTITGQFVDAGSGGLGALSSIDVSTAVAATAALGTIETLIDTSIDATAAFGSVEGRIEIQTNFVTKLTDSMKSGIGALVDANMEEASARLQALQVQQQLATQSLSIANSAPQSILSLFRV